VWVCGCAASGKSRIGASAILPLGFELIDTDKIFDKLLREYRLSLEIPAPTPEEKESGRRRAVAKRIAQRLVGEQGATIDPQRLVERLTEAASEGSLEREYAESLAVAVCTKLGAAPVSEETFQRAVWPKMIDWTDPLDYLEDKAVTQDHLQVVAREITRRALVQAQKERKNLLIVATGGETGKILKMRMMLMLEGYETFLVWVNLRCLDDALRRNWARGLTGERCLHTEIIERSFRVAQKNRAKLIEAFQPSVLAIDNSEDGEAPLGNRLEEVREAIGAWLSR